MATVAGVGTVFPGKTMEGGYETLLSASFVGPANVCRALLCGFCLCQLALSKIDFSASRRLHQSLRSNCRLQWDLFYPKWILQPFQG